MPDERDKYRRAGTLSDARDRRRQADTPVPHPIDPELTPPPQEPPPPRSLPGYDTIPPPIKDQLELLSRGLGQVTEALGKVWDARKDAEKLERIDAKLGTLAEYATRHQTMLDDFVVPMTKSALAAANQTACELPKLVASIEALGITVATIDKRVRDLEVEFRTSLERWNGTHQALAARLTSAEAVGNSIDVRLTAVEQQVRDRNVEARAIAKVQSRKTGGLATVVAAVVSAVAAAIAHVTQ